MQEYPSFSIVVLNYNGRKVLRPCIESILKTDYPNFEIILVDNHSSDGSIEEAELLFKHIKNLKIIKNPVPLFYAGGNNVGFSHATGEYIIFINNDTEVDPAWLRELAVIFEDRQVGAVQPKIMYYDYPDTIDNVGLDFDVFGFGYARAGTQKDTGRYNEPEEITFASGVAMAVRRELLERIGVFDEKFIFYYEDIDLSWRIRLSGFKIILCPNARVFHKVSKTTRVFSSRQELSFHARKNRLATLFRNYNLCNLYIFLPGTLLIYLFLYFKEVFVNRNLPLANTVILSLIWNARNYGHNVSKRRLVQTKLRKINDGDIIKLMRKTPLFLKYS